MNLDYFQLAVIIVAVVGSAIIKNGVGIGSGIFLVTLLSLILPPKIALGLGAPAMFISDIVGIRNYWKEWNKGELLLLVPSASIGVVVGSVAVRFTPNEVFRIWVGSFALIIAIYNLGKGRFFKWKGYEMGFFKSLDSKKLTGFFGFLGGVASTIIHAGGLVMSLFLLKEQSDKRIFVGTLVVFFAIVNFLKMVAYTGIGILTSNILLLVLFASPLIVLGGNVGNALNRRVEQEHFRTIVLLVILLIGARLLIG